MKQKLRILIIVGVLLIVAIITKIAFADTENTEEELTQDSIIELGKEKISRDKYKEEKYKSDNLINPTSWDVYPETNDDDYPLTREEMEILSKRYNIVGNATAVMADTSATEDEYSEEIVDSIINTDDAMEILKLYCELILAGDDEEDRYLPTKAQLYVCDVDRDGDIDSDDACTVLRYYTEIGQIERDPDCTSAESFFEKYEIPRITAARQERENEKKQKELEENNTEDEEETEGGNVDETNEETNNN